MRIRSAVEWHGVHRSLQRRHGQHQWTLLLLGRLLPAQWRLHQTAYLPLRTNLGRIQVHAHSMPSWNLLERNYLCHLNDCHLSGRYLF